MATEQVRIVVTAQDQATAVINNVTHASENLFQKLATGFAQGIGQQAFYQFQNVALNALGSVSDAIIGFNSHMEQSRLGWETMLGGAQQANFMLKQLQDFAQRTPFTFPTVEQGARRLVAMGIAAKDVIPTMTAIATAGAALGLGNEGINRVTLALGQMQSKTRVSAEEMLQLTEAGIPAWDILAKHMGLSTAQVQKLAENGKIASSTFIEAFREMYGEGSKFANLLNAQATTWEGAISNLQDAIQTNLATAFEPVFQALRDLVVMVSQFATSGGLTEWARRTAAALQALGITIQTLAADQTLRTAIAATVGGLAAMALVINYQLIPSTVAATVAFIRMAAAFALANLPLFLLAAAIGAITVVIIANWEDIGPVVEQVVNFVIETVGNLVNWLTTTAIPALVKEWTEGWDRIGQNVHDIWNEIAKLWNEFWSLLLADQSEGGGGLAKAFTDIWGYMADFFTWAIEKMVGGWNNLIDAVDKLKSMGISLGPFWDFLSGKRINLGADALQGFNRELKDLPTSIGRAFSGLGDFVQKIPGAVGKAIDLVKVAWQSITNINLGDLIDNILKAMPTGAGSEADLKGQDIGKTIGDSMTKALKPLIEQLALDIAKLLGLPVKEALEDTQYRIKEIDLLLALRGEDKLPPEERAALRRERRDLTRFTLPPEELAAAREERVEQLLQRPLTRATLQQQIQQNILDQAKQAAEASGQAVTDASSAAATKATGAPTQVAGAPTAVAPKAGAEPTRILLTINQTYDGGEATQIYEELFEANGQAITPPAIQLSGVRRS